jgi:hypothetical protein
MKAHTSPVKVYLSVCEDVEGVTIANQTYRAGTSGEEVPATIRRLPGDRVLVKIEGVNATARVGGASSLTDISVRVCRDTITFIACYSQHEMNRKGCCACCTSGDTRICVYGYSECYVDC